jgi:hypothetical protein
MVAFNCSRRKESNIRRAVRSVVEALTNDLSVPLDSVLHASSSHRDVQHVDVRKDAQGRLAEVRIGRWRVIAAGENRRLAEVRELGCERIAIRIERFADNGVTPSSEIWQLYRLDGRLEAALQTTPDGKFALLTNYRTRQACRLVANQQGELRPVEMWTI